MADFGEALKKGLAAHQQADEARKEMDEVLAAASADVAKAMGKPISLRFQTVTRPTRRQTLIEQAAGIVAPSEEIIALVARLESSYVTLAEATFGELGYTVSLRWNGSFYTATNRSAFEQAIERLLEASSTGKKIAALLRGEGD